MVYKKYKTATGMKGPYPLNKVELSKVAYDNYGTYLLANQNNEVEYVGRGHLRTRLKVRIGMYNQFYYKVNNIELTRFKKECEEYHRYGKSTHLDNQIHPAKPAGNYPKCTELGCNGESN